MRRDRPSHCSAPSYEEMVVRTWSPAAAQSARPNIPRAPHSACLPFAKQAVAVAVGLCWRPGARVPGSAAGSADARWGGPDRRLGPL